MHFLIMGAGAVGSAFGAFLKLSGHTVTLVGRKGHMDAVRNQGLAVSGIWGGHLAKGIAVHTGPETVRGPFDAIFVSVKSFDTALAGRAVKPLLSDATLLISLQNGLGNIETLAAAAACPHVLGGRVIFGTTVERPGAVRVTVYTQPVMIGFPKKALPAAPPALVQKAKAAARAIHDAGIPCEYTGEIEKYLWAKLLYNCALNPLGALHKVHYGALGEDPALKKTMDAIVAEIFAVARARGTALFWNGPREFLDLFYSKLLPDTYHHRSSMLQDLERGRRTEIDSLSGMVVRYGREAGVPTPVNKEMMERIKALGG
jgi:2-dehydropantoate 2-reductase